MAIQRARYLPFANEQAAYNRYRNGELHAIASSRKRACARRKKSCSKSAPVAVVVDDVLGFNLDAAFDDVRVRTALASVVDQNLLADKVLRSGAERLKPSPEMITACKRRQWMTAMPSDLSNARSELLAEAGYDAKRPLRILRHVSGNEEKRVNLAVAGMWRQLGVQTQLQQGTMNATLQICAKVVDVAWAGWIDKVTPSITWALASDVGDVNAGRYHSAEFDQLIQQARTHADVQSRNNLLQQAGAVALREAPVVPLYVSDPVDDWLIHLRWLV